MLRASQGTSCCAGGSEMMVGSGGSSMRTPVVLDPRKCSWANEYGTRWPATTNARVGYSRPGWTPKEAIEKGLLVMVDGSNLINRRNTQHYLFTQAYSIIMAEINHRQPGNPNDQPVSLVMDEVYSLLSIPGMAEEVGMLAPLYRSRKLQPYVVLQALSQLAPNLRQQIWSIGNVMCFAICIDREDIALDFVPINPDGPYTLTDMFRVLHLDPVDSSPKPPGHFEPIPSPRNAGGDF